MRKQHALVAAIIIIIGLVSFFFWQRPRVSDVPMAVVPPQAALGPTIESAAEVMTTNGTRHSIPLEEIISGGPPKDGIPSIDSPIFVGAEKAKEFLSDEDVGQGIFLEGEARFYPNRIMVWHEIVNDTIAGQGVTVTYCPLCGTGIAFSSLVAGQVAQFGVSGKLWQSNLLMYNRTPDPINESLWSQVLGEAVVGPLTGTKLESIPTSTVPFGDWLSQYPQTKVLSAQPGSGRDYENDPYESYYTSASVSFGTSFRDRRLHPKEPVLGAESNGRFKAWQKIALKEGTTTDTLAGKEVTISKDKIGQVTIRDADGKIIPIIESFWFSWLAVHPKTELFYDKAQ